MQAAAMVAPMAIAASKPLVALVCPLCHTPERVTTRRAVAGGATWACRRCGQRWSRRQLDIVGWDASTRQPGSVPGNHTRIVVPPPGVGRSPFAP